VSGNFIHFVARQQQWNPSPHYFFICKDVIQIPIHIPKLPNQLGNQKGTCTQNEMIRVLPSQPNSQPPGLPDNPQLVNFE